MPIGCGPIGVGPIGGGQLLFAGANSYIRTTADAPTTTDTITRALVEARAAADAPQTIDALVRTEVLHRIGADAPTTSDTVSRTEVMTRSVSDTQTITESLVRTEVLARALSDSPIITDSLARTQVLTRTNSDSPATTDLLIGASGAHVLVDSPHTADTVSRIETLIRTAADSCFTVDTVVRTTVLNRSASDLPQTSDTLTASTFSGLARSLQDQPQTTDSLSVSLVMFRSASDLPHTADQLDTDAGIVPDAIPSFVPFRYYVPSFSFTGRSSQNTDIQKVLGATPAQIIRSCLIDFGLVTYPIKPPGTWPCYAFSMPDGPDNAICVYDVVGRLFGRGARTGKNNVHPGVQVTVRGSDELQGYLKAQNIANVFDTNFPVITIAPEDHQTHNIMSIYRVSPIMTLGEEIGKRRYLWTLDVRVAFEYDEPSLG